MIVLGIDPGTIAMGYGVIKSRGGDTVYIDCGVLKPPSHSLIGERLSYLYKTLTEVISQNKPDVLAIEQPFVSKNVKSAFAIGRAQAIAILAAANYGIPAYEYSPSQIKQHVTSYGASSKEQVQEMVRLQLGLKDVTESYDASDALAVALCHLGETHISNLLSER
jgi:crossover junction endodeoxyribonuclease RuvC